MITGNYDELKDYPAKYHCPEHPEALLTCAWHAGEQNYVIRCGAGHFPEEVTAKKSRTQQFRQGELEKVDPSFSLLPTTDLGSGQPLTPVQAQGLVKYAEKYGLDAYRGHVVLMYGDPYIGLDGYCFKLNESGKPYNLTSRPLTTLERKDYQVPEGDHAWIGYLNVNQGEIMTQGLGIVTKDEMQATSKKDKSKLAAPVVAAHPWQMAQKRAEWQALRRGVPIGESPSKEEGDRDAVSSD